MTSEIVAAQKVVAQARRRIPAALLQVSGRALYAPAFTLVSGSPYYFLGVNPGEAPAPMHLHSTTTVEADLRRLEEGNIKEHGYIDEQWKNHPPGRAPIQVRGQQLFALLAGGSHTDGVALLRITPTSNFILQRSPNVETLVHRTGLSTAQLVELPPGGHRSNSLHRRSHTCHRPRSSARSLSRARGGSSPSIRVGWLSCQLLRLAAAPRFNAPGGPKPVALHSRRPA